MTDETHQDQHENYQTIHTDGKLMGVLPKKEDPRTLQLKMLVDTLKSPPPAWDFELKWGTGPDPRYKKPFEPFRGQQWGSCTISSQAEWARRQERKVQFGKDLYISDEVVNKRYFRLAGDTNFESGTFNPQFDTGLYELDAINDFRAVGFSFGAWIYKIDGFAEIDIKDLDAMKMAIVTFGGIKVCINVPANLYHSNPDEVVDYVPGSQEVGGHSMYWNAYDDASQTFTLVHTWNRKRQKVTYAFAKQYVTEAYSLIDAKDIKVQQVIDVSKFKAAVKEAVNTPLT